jgi:hypothetical protein
MPLLKRGQHYDRQDPETVKAASAILNAIKRHLNEERCNHTLTEIVHEALEIK